MTQWMCRLKPYLNCEHSYFSNGIQWSAQHMVASKRRVIFPNGSRCFHRWWHHSIYVAQSSMIYGILAFICHHCFHLICFHLSWDTHRPHPWLISTSSAIIHTSHDLGPICGPWHCGRKVENVVEERDNRILKETRCHLETKEVPLKENCIWDDSVLFNVSSLLVLYTWISKKATLVLLEGKYSRSLLLEASSYLPNNHTQFLHWIPWLLTWRAC